MRMLYYNDGNLQVVKRENNLILNGFKENGVDIELYELNDKDWYRNKSKHFQVYENFLDYADKTKPDIAFIRGLSFPEHLLPELQARPDFHSRVSFMFYFRESARSMARAITMKSLLEMPQVKKGFISSMVGKYQDVPNNWKKVNPDKNKYIIVPEVLHETPKDFKADKIKARRYFGLPEDKFVCLFFGAINYSKGLDILLDAMEYLDDDFELMVQSFTTDFNYDFDIYRLLGKDKITFNNSFIDDESVGSLFSACDLVVLPYRNEYSYSSSWVGRLSALAKKPIVVPNFSPFNIFINKFKTGETFESESPRALADSINRIKLNYGDIMKNALFEQYVDLTLNWTELTQEIVKNL